MMPSELAKTTISFLVDILGIYSDKNINLGLLKVPIKT
jgi:hypothetical protein